MMAIDHVIVVDELKGKMTGVVFLDLLKAIYCESHDFAGQASISLYGKSIYRMVQMSTSVVTVVILRYQDFCNAKSGSYYSTVIKPNFS